MGTPEIVAIYVAEYPNGDQRLEDVLYMVTIKRKHNKSTSVLISGFQEWGKVGGKNMETHETVKL